MADLILLNADILSIPQLDPKKRLIAVRNGVISAVTSTREVNTLKTRNTLIIDCTGRTVMPGFIDAHLHLRAFAESMGALNLTPAQNVRSISDIQARIKTLARTLPAGAWIRGKGYHEFDLAEKRHPTRQDLDLAAPDHPVKLSHRSGHAHALNSLALKCAGISGETGDPDGGLIDRQVPSGEPSGVLFQMGRFLSERVPPMEKSLVDRGVRAASERLLSLGITSVQDASRQNGIRQWQEFHRWKEDGLFAPRMSVFLGYDSHEAGKTLCLDPDPDEARLRMNGIKFILDRSTGRLHPPEEEFNEAVLSVHRAGMRVAVHAIEEPDIRSACEAIALAQKTSHRSGPRHRIEHCSVCPPELAERIASCGIIVVTQPPFVYFNGDRYLATVPEDQKNHLYPFAALIKKGVVVAAGSDCPVVPPDPFIGIYAAMSRKTRGGNTLAPEERIAFADALRMYTASAAAAAGEECLKGSISPKKMADLVIVDGSPQTLPQDAVKELKVETTILDGKIVWQRRP